ncbi:MAG TPA: DUF1326 domain-containing protein [Longimicrobiaceae bacterium]|nr:DUF1326 domain-containing protein [Longimicrobiaceae bacterium]
MSVAEAPVRTQYRIRAHNVEACNCAHGCNCQFGGFPNEGKCEFIVGYDITDGTVGDVDLKGVRSAVAAKYPGAIHEGNGHLVLFVDPEASDEQMNALLQVMSGELGGMPWEALAPTMSRIDGPVRARVEVEYNGTRSSVRVNDAIDLHLEPLLNPVTGAEQDVHVVYPSGGFLWDDGTIATTTRMKASYGDLEMEWPAKYAAVSEVNWTNQI